jgi:phosphatidylethanolamine/phosphatidyl-N-methylethanolamine N-methyltransferase
MIKENLVMFKGAFTHFKHTGCLCGSSKWAAEALARPLNKQRAPMNILEAGAGTGAVTLNILRYMIPGDKLVICEINSEFMKILKKRLEENKLYQKYKDNVVFFNGPIQELSEDIKFNVIVCALPFLNFELSLVKEIFEKFERISAAEGVLTYFEYLGIRPISKLVSPANRKKRMQEIEDYIFNEHQTKRINKEVCWLNLTPINVYTLGIAA